MVKFKTENFIGIVFVVCIYFMSFMCIIGLIPKYKNADKGDVWDSAKEYPVNDVHNKEKESVFSSIDTKIKKVEEDIEYCVSTGFYYKMPFVLTKKMCDKLIGLDMTTSLRAGENDTIDMTDVVVPYADESLGWICDDTDIEPMLNALSDFCIKMQKDGRNILYFEPIVKFSESGIYKDYSYDKEKEVHRRLDLNNIPYVCMYDEIGSRSPADLEKYFYKTDHHWTAATGIWADKILCNTLNERYGYEFDTGNFEPDSYSTSNLENASIGSLGKKVTEVYAQREDFLVHCPKYDSDLSVFMSSTGDTTTGKIEDTLLNKNALDYTDLYNTAKYVYYGYANQALVSIHNQKVTDGSHILMLKASYANCMYPFFASVVEDLDVVDLRLFRGSIISYIEEINPDTIVIVYDLSQYGKSSIENSCFDFR